MLRLEFFQNLSRLCLLMSTVSVFFAGYCLAAKNPAAEYCVAMGYSFIAQEESTGAVGYCLLPDSTKVLAWNFYKGKIAQEFSYCARKGYEMKTRETAHKGFTAEEPVCVPKNKASSVTPLPMIEMMRQEGLIKEHALLKRKLPDVVSVSDLREEFKEKTYPASFDWRNYNGRSYIGNVRNQGFCGSCYAFGAAAAAEGSYNYVNNKYGANVVDFSESFIAWCLGTYGPYSAHFDGCNGADYEYKELEALTIEGITWEANFPYTGVDPGSCTHGNDPVVKFETWGRVPSNNIEQIKGAISTYGVIDAAVFVTSAFEGYNGGIFQNSNQSCPSNEYTATNHAVALVGWGTDATHGTYWILRNSWGSNWGESGYMRVQAQSAAVGCAATYLKAKSAGGGGTNPSTPTPGKSITQILGVLLGEDK